MKTLGFQKMLYIMCAVMIHLLIPHDVVGSIVVGDMDRSGSVDLRDAILILRANVSDKVSDLELAADVNRDQRLGLEDTIYVLQETAQMRTINTRPEKPVLVSPSNMKTIETLTPELMTQPFLDADPGDVHLKTRWQVSVSDDFSSIVIDKTSDIYLISFTPDKPLNNQTIYYWRVRFTDSRFLESDWSAVFWFKTVAVNHPPVKPVLLFPKKGDVNVSLTPLLQTESFSDPDPDGSHLTSQWQISIGPDFDTMIVDVTDSTHLVSYPVPKSKLCDNTVYYWRVRFADNHQFFSDWSDNFWFRTLTVNRAPGSPVLLSPSNGQTGVPIIPEFRTQSFFDPDEGDYHKTTTWQISDSPDFAQPIIQIISDKQLTSMVIPEPLPSHDAIYYWRVMFYDSQHHPSEWSQVFWFRTQPPNQPPHKPILLSPQKDQTNVSLTPILTCHPFSDPDVGDSHSKSYWQVSRDPDFRTFEVNSETEYDLTSYRISSPLESNTMYFWRVRFKDSRSGLSDWSDIFCFRTAPGNSPPEKPKLKIPFNGQIDVPLTVQLQTENFFDFDLNDVHTKTYWQISNDPNFSTAVIDKESDSDLILLPIIGTSLAPGKIYYWRVKFFDSHGNPSEWSDPFRFKTAGLNRPPNTPVLKSPMNNQKNVPLTVRLETEPFSDPDEGDTHGQTQWQISTTADFLSPVFDKHTSEYLEQITVIEVSLKPNTRYFWRVKFFDNHIENNESEWSEPSEFFTVLQNYPPDKPILDQPVDGGQTSLTPLLQTKNFSDPDPGDIHHQTQWQVSASQDFLELSVNVTSSEFLTQYQIKEALKPNTLYLWKVRFTDNHGNTSDWSEPFRLTPKALNHPPTKPLLFEPLDGEKKTSVTPELKTGMFSDPDPEDQHRKTRWQVSTFPDFLNQVIDETSEQHLTSYPIITPLQSGIIYFWRVLFIDDHGNESEWSDPFWFKTISGNKPPDVPVLVSPSDGQCYSSRNPEFKTRPFSDPDPGDSHLSTQWQISEHPDFLTLVVDRIDKIHLTSFRPDESILKAGSVYFWRVRFFDSHAESSEWSEPFWFKTEIQNPIVFKFDFAQGLDGWTADFSDYPPDDEPLYQLDWKWAPLPDNLQPNFPSKKSVFISGYNHSDDLFMFIKRRIFGLIPDVTYRIIFTITIATNAPIGDNVSGWCAGVGGAPSDVWVKAGATKIEPTPEIHGAGYWLNIDKGNQSLGGKDAIVLGNIANTVKDCASHVYELKTLDNRGSPFEVTSDSNGSLWIIVGTDSGFESITALYYSEIEIRCEKIE